MTNKSTLAQGLSHAWPWTKPIGSSPTTSRLLRYSLLCMLVLLCGGSMWAEDAKTETLTLNTTAGYEELTITKAGVSSSGGQLEISKGNIIVTSDKGYIKDHEMTIYKGGNINISFPSTISAHITKIEFVVSNYHFASPTDWTAGSTYDTSSKFSSDATEVFTTTSNDKRSFSTSNASNGKTTVKSIVVTYVIDSQSSVAAPVITPESGTYYEEQTVKMTCETEGASIYYTLDGATPTASSTLYTQGNDGFKISETKTIKAIAIKGEASSNITTSEITIAEKVIANPYTYTFESKVFETKKETKELANVKWALEYTCSDATGTLMYDNSKGQQIGSGSTAKAGNPITLSTSDIPGVIKKITVNTSGASSINGFFSVTVDGKPYKCGEESSVKLTDSADEYTFEGARAGEIILKWTQTSAKAIYVKSITIDYDKNGTPSTTKGTTIELGEHVSNGYVNESMDIPTVTLKDEDGETISGAITWSSTNEDVATIDNVNNKINFVGIGTTTIKASYAGDETNYEGCTESFPLTINEAPLTTASALNAAAIEGGKEGKNVTYNFTNAKVVYVSGNYNYIADETGYALLYKDNLGLTAGKVITGTLTGSAKTYNDLPEIAVTTIEVTSSGDDTDVPTPTTISIDKLANNVNNYIKVENAEYVSVNSKTLTFKVGETNLTVYNQFDLSTTDLTQGKSYDITGFGSINKGNYQIYPTAITEYVTPTPDPFYILGVEGWELPADMKEMTWNAESQAYEYPLNNTSTAYFCFADGGTDVTAGDWTTFNSTYRWSATPGSEENNVVVTLTEGSYQKQLEKGIDKSFELAPGNYVISVTANKLLTITGEATPVTPTEDTYVVAGGYEGNLNPINSFDPLLGTRWDEANENNKMTKQDNGTYKLEIENATLYKGTYEFKIVNGDSWIPANNIQQAISETGIYNAVFTFNPDNAEESALALTKQEGSVAIVAAGGFGDEDAGLENVLFTTTWQASLEANKLTEQEDGTFTKVYEKVALPATTINYKIVVNVNDWVGDSEGANLTYAIAEAGNYDVTVTYNPITRVAEMTATAVDEIPSIYTVKYAKESDVEGTIPAEVEVTIGEAITLPKNYTLYKEGYTQSGWTDGNTTFELGASYTPEDDVTLTAVFTENEVSLSDREDEVTITYALDGTQGNHNINNSGVVVTQATIGDKIIDVAMNITAGSLVTNNGGWHQVKNNFKATIPSAKGATVVINTYDDPTSLLTFGGSSEFEVSGSNHAWTATYTATADATSLDIAQSGSTYWNKLEITLPKVESTEPGGDDITATWDFQNVNPSTLSTLSIQKNQTGSVASNVKGIVLNVIANDGKLQQRTSDAQFNSGAVIQVPVKNKGDKVVVVSYPDYHYYTIGGTEAGADTETYEAKQSDATKGYVEIIATNTAYLYSITVTQYAQKEATTLDNEPATVTFPFNLGIEGQKATFSNEDYWLNSKVEVGGNMGYANTRTLGDVTFTKIQPQTAAASAAAEDYVLFRVQPKPGFTFTPTSVSLNAYKDGTGNGNLTIKWVTADGTEYTLDTDKAIARNSETPAFSSLSYEDLSSVVPAEGICGLKVYIGGKLATNKQVGLSNICINGTLSGTEKELPILASFKANGTEYTVDEVFGDEYEATLELSKTETIVSESNPLTEITATSGEVGNVVYADATESSCKVTIPVTAGSTTLEYVLNVVHKPDFTLQYISVDGTTVLEEQTVEKDAKIGEFAYNIANVEASKEGYKARGWFKNNYVGEKWTTESVITADAKLYAVETEIEVSSDSKKYVFDLTDKNFDAADHEAFNPTGSGAWHDNQHGWVFANGDKIDLLVGGKASIIITTCKYPENGTTKITASNEKIINAVSATDGATATIEYEGKPGTLTLTFDGTAYIHKLTIFNTTTTNYEVNGDWIIVKEGDASSLADAIESAKEGTKIFLPNGTYDLGQKTLTTVGSNNVSIIGESMEGVIIKNRPTAEGISTTATLLNTSTGLYMQDLTLQNDWDYYNGGADGRAVCIQDKGTQTICKNVTLLSYQDTYYTNNTNGEYYWETSDIHGTVDFICGEGTLFMEESTLTVEKRKADGSGECTITAPSTAAGKEVGYVFNNCKIENSAASFNLGRAWNNEPRCAFISPTYNDAKLIANRWNLNGMNTIAKEFVEYNPSDGVTENNVTFKYNSITYETNTIISDASNFTLDKVFTSWTPATYTKQVAAPKAKLSNDGKKITWTPANDGATAYAIFKDGKFLGITTGSEWTIEEVASAPALRRAEEPEKTGYTIRAANSRGGFGPAAEVSPATGIANINAELNGDVKIYDLNGRRVMTPTKGVYIINGKKTIIK